MKKILCFGDSNTWGHNPVDCSKLEKTWCDIAAEILTDYEIISDGVCGRTTHFDLPNEDGKNGFTSFKKYLELDNAADLLIVMLGTNDTLNYFDCSPTESANSLREYISLWKKSFPKSSVLLVSPIHITESSLTHPIFSTLYTMSSVEKSFMFAAEYEKIANEENAASGNVYFLDAAKYAAPSDIDGIHMNPENHAKLAAAISDKVKEIFKAYTL